jgi:hypothetical protein
MATSVEPEIRELALEGLREWPRNPRRISKPRLEQLKRALTAEPEMLRARPLIALPDGTVIAGNQRLRAARELGWQTIPVVTVSLERERARLWALRDNNSYGEWEEQALAELLAELGEGGVDLALSGFADRELERLLAGIEPAADPDEAPPLPGEPESELGRIYQLGPHRLACGDARDRELLERLLGDAQPVVLWSDPPYGVDYVGKTKRALAIANDDERAPALLEAALRAADPLLAPAARFYLAVPARRKGQPFGSRSSGSAGGTSRRSSGSRTRSCWGARITTTSTRRSSTASGPAPAAPAAALTRATAGTATTPRARSSSSTARPEAKRIRP